MQKIDAIHNIVNPRSVAFVGASNTFTKWGFQILHNLLMGKYPGKIYPVNPSQKEILGYPAYPSVSAIPEPVDLAVFTIPAEKLPEAISQCVQKGIPAGLVISAGFAELGEKGIRLEREMTQRARAGGMVLVGPNCQGTACPAAHFYLWMPTHFPQAGSISIVSQSGNILTWLGQCLEDYGFGIAKAISCGNLCDLDWDDYLLYLESDPETRVILLYIEGIRDGRRFFEVAKRVNRTKPILVFKGGTSQEGYRAARSHTGVMAGNDAVFDAACKQAGLIRVETMLEATCISAGFVATPLPKGRRLAIVTTGGGLGVLASDLCAKYAVELPVLSARTVSKLGRIMPPYWVAGNPVDMAAGINYAQPLEVISLLDESGEIDGILFIGLGWVHRMADFSRLSPLSSNMNLGEFVEAMRLWDAEQCRQLRSLIRSSGCPILLNSNSVSIATSSNFRSLVELLQSGVMIFPSIELSIKAFSDLAFYGRVRRDASGRQPE